LNFGKINERILELDWSLATMVKTIRTEFWPCKTENVFSFFLFFSRLNECTGIANQKFAHSIAGGIRSVF